MKTLITIFTLVCLAACSSEPRPIECPGERVIREPFMRKLAEVAGSAARECGFVSLNTDASGALTCARGMLDGKDPFLIGVQFQGIDSYVWEGVAADASGQLSYVTFDSDTMGSVCKNPRVTVVRCASIILPNEKGQQFQCLTE